MAPLVVKGKVLVGNSGGEFGVRGWLTALDAGTGKLAWRAYTTGPDSDVLIGPRFKPFYPQDRGTDLGVSTWPGDAWKIGGGSVWGWISYDPELDLVYYGTANPGPWNPDLRPGDNKWTAGIFARDPDTGEAVWAYQWSPHDLYDYDGVNEQLLLDLPINGRTRKVLVRPERNGYIYVLDRATGEVLSADPYALHHDYQGRRPQDRPPDRKPGEGARRRARWSATSVPPRRAPRTGSPARARRGPGCSTSRTRTCARTRRAPRPTTSPARRTSART